MKLSKVIATLLFILSASFVSGQEKVKITEDDYKNQQVEMADEFRSNGKIYVLTGIMLIVVIGMIIYLITIDKKVSRLEKQLDNNEG